jgi:surface-anchored protein
MSILAAGVCLADANDCPWRASEVTSLYFGVEVPIPDPNHPVTVDLFHTDIDTPWLSGDCAWDILVSHDEPNAPPGGTPIAPEDALLYVNSAAQVTLPSIPPQFGFIGATPGVPFWVLPQNPNPSVLYLGLASSAMSPGSTQTVCEWNPNDPRGGANVPGRWLRVQLLDVIAPPGGHFSMWQTGAGGSVDAFYSTFDGGITGQDVFHMLAGSHTHENWGFTEPGLYEVVIQVSAPVVYPRGDANCDTDIDGDDFVLLPDCWAGPETLPSPTPPTGIQQCFNWFDFDGDFDADLEDAAAFQAAFGV